MKTFPSCWRRSVCILAGLLALGLSAVAAPEAGRVTSPVVTEVARVDGIADELFWKHAAIPGTLVPIGVADGKAEAATRVRICHTKTDLLLHIVCEGESPKQKRLSRDSRDVYRRDHLELFLDPTIDSPDYCQFVVDSAGTVRDVWVGTAEDPARRKNWDSDCEVATVHGTNGWQVEIRIPFASFAVPVPLAGTAWRLKIGRDGGPVTTAMWPPNPTTSFHARAVDALLYFERSNLLRNGDFESGEDRSGAPAPWSATLTSTEVDNAPQGTVQTVVEGALAGERSLRLTKLRGAMWWPQVWDSGYALSPGGVYELSALVCGSLPRMNLRATQTGGEKRLKISKTCTVPRENPARIAIRFAVADEAKQVAIGISAPRVEGSVLIDEMVLRRVLDTDGAERRSLPKPLVYVPDPDPIHGLDAHVERVGVKPWDLFRRDDGLLTSRILFKDRVHGTDLWRIDHSRSTQYVVTASIWSGWNADGSVLMCNGRRPWDGDDVPSRWLFNADFSRMRPMPHGSQPLWDLEDPGVYYSFAHEDENGKRVTAIYRIPFASGGAAKRLATFPARPRDRSYGLTRDNRSVFVTDCDGGEWVPYTPWPDKPLPSIRVLDCYGSVFGESEPYPSLDIAAEIDGVPHIRILKGTRVYTSDGRAERVIVPICGHHEYLRMFASGRVRFPEDAGARLPSTKDVNELFDVYKLYPSCSHGHISYSPDGEYVAWDGEARSYRVRDNGDLQKLGDLTSNGWVYHTCWFEDPRSYVTVVRPYSRYMKVDNGGVMVQGFADGSWQAICDIKQRPAAYYYQGNFATVSRDATKIHYESSMTGIPKNYVAVMARPQAPRHLRARAVAEGIRLEWSAAPRHAETRGYHVYRSARSGEGYEQLTKDPVRACSWTDESADSAADSFYVVTSLEHCGLESGLSNEAFLIGKESSPKLLRIYVETESALVDLPTAARPGLTRLRDRLGASNWYGIRRHPSGKSGKVQLTVPVLVAGSYRAWLRVRRADGDMPAAWQVAVGGRPARKVACQSGEWSWTACTEKALVLETGDLLVELGTDSSTAQADVFLLVSDPDFVPTGPRPEDAVPPVVVTGFRAQAVRDRVVQLSWDASPARDLDHYNVYASRGGDVKVEQRSLIGSPTENEFVDWGLRGGATYAYTVVAVDRRGNKSAPCASSSVVLAPRTTAEQHIELRFDQAALEGPWEKRQVTGTRGDQFVILPKGEKKAVATAEWELDIPFDTTLYIWLRFLPEGAANVRSAAVKQAVSLLLDGKGVVSLAPGLTDLSVADGQVRPDLWTWARPGGWKLLGVPVSAGTHRLRVADLTPTIRYDCLHLTDEPSWQPTDGRLWQRDK